MCYGKAWLLSALLPRHGRIVVWRNGVLVSASSYQLGWILAAVMLVSLAPHSFPATYGTGFGLLHPMRLLCHRCFWFSANSVYMLMEILGDMVLCIFSASCCGLLVMM